MPLFLTNCYNIHIKELIHFETTMINIIKLILKYLKLLSNTLMICMLLVNEGYMGYEFNLYISKIMLCYVMLYHSIVASM